MNPLDQPTPYAGAPEWPKPFAGTPTGIIGETCSQPLHDLVHRTPTLSPTPRTDAAYFANGATMYSLAGEMKLIERELAETERLRFGADADRRRLRCELAAAKAECERLKDEILAIGAKPMFYQPQSYAATRANEIQQERQLNELTRLRAEVERLKGALALGQQNCDDAYDDLREERDEAIARAEKAEAEIARMKRTP
jgi:chromosome segregation ATPase